MLYGETAPQPCPVPVCAEARGDTRLLWVGSTVTLHCLRPIGLRCPH